MGLGIHIKAQLSRPIDFFAIRDCITSHTTGLLKNFLSFSENDGSLYVTLHPCEETVDFSHKDGSLICSAKTNSVGPGYHAYAVELIERIGIELQISWLWDFEDGEEYYSDETGYYTHRDFRQLQVEMLRWLKVLSESLTDTDDSKQHMLSLPLGYPRMRKDYFAMSSKGIWTREMFERIARSEVHELDWAGEDYFIWWNRKDDAQFYKSTGIALLNVECPWHHPANDKEKKILDDINSCFQLASQLDNQIDFPYLDWAVVKNFIHQEDTDIPDSEVGFRKHMMTFDLPGQWLIDLPGNLHYTIDDDTEVYYNHDYNVRCICYIRNGDQTDREFADDFFADRANTGVEFLDSATDVVGKAIVYHTVDKDLDQEYWILQGVKVVGDKFVFSTICYPTEGHKQWAVDTWNSIMRFGF